MSASTPTSLQKIGVVMLTVADVDASLAWYTEKLGFEVRADQRFGPEGENRWLEVAPPGSPTSLSLNPPMDNQPGGTSVGLETSDLEGEHARLRGLDGVDVDPELMSPPGAPSMFSVRDPDGNSLWVVGAAAAS